MAANINLTVLEKPFINFAPVSVALLRNQQNAINTDLNYSNGTGQQMTAGQVLYLNGNPSGIDYTQVKVVSDTTISGTGSIPIEVTAYPNDNQQNQTVQSTFDGSTMTFNLSYNSLPKVNNIDIVMDNRSTRNFLISDFEDKFTGYDGNTLASVAIYGNVSQYQYDTNGSGNYVPYVSGTWISVSNIPRLRYVCLDQDDYYYHEGYWLARDNMGLESLNAIPNRIVMIANQFVPNSIQYSSGSLGVGTLCNTADYDKIFVYNNLSVPYDFNVGLNFTNSLGYPAQTLRIENYTDESYFLNNNTGDRIPSPGFVPKKIRNSTTNTLVTTFPYNIPIANLNQLTVELGGDGLICEPNPNPAVYSAIRVRTLYYRILDTQGNVGPLKDFTRISTKGVQ
jgi:hypothetical protein